MYLIDTNVLSEIRKIQSSHTPPEFLAWFNAINLNDCYLSVITLLEIEQGILRVQHRGDEAQFLRLQQWLNDTVIPNFDQRILPIAATPPASAPACACPTNDPTTTRSSPPPPSATTSRW